MKMRFAYLLTLFVIVGCSSQPKINKTLSFVAKPELMDESVMAVRPDIPDIQEIIKISQNQRDDFFKEFNENTRDYPSLRVFDYMQSHLQSASYSHVTLSASDVLSNNSGNCLSLAILTKALADEAGIDIRFQMVKSPPVFQRSNDIILSSQHIRSVLYNRKLRKDKIPGKKIKSIAIDYNPSEETKTLRWVDDDEFFSLYYINRAAELLTENKVSDSYWYLKEALNYKGSNIQAINMMGIIHSRLGFHDEAEQWYVYGLSFGRDQFELLKNYYSLLKRNNRTQEAEKIRSQLGQYNAKNPFDWVDLGDDAFANNNFELANRYYKKAIKMADYLHEPYAGIAKVEFKQGNTKKAYKAMRKALANTKNDNELSLYQEKYKLLSNLLRK